MTHLHLNLSQEKLQDVLVVTVKKSFWASPESSTFPRIVYARKIYGHSQQLINSWVTFAFALNSCVRARPKLLLIGSSVRLVPWFIKLKQAQLLSDVKLITVNQLTFDDQQAKYVDRIVVYSREEIQTHSMHLRPKYVFFPLAADGDFRSLQLLQGEDYVFSGGGAGRDFASLVEAARGTEIPLRIVTFSKTNLSDVNLDRLPPNVVVEYRMPLQEFLRRMAVASSVVVPLRAGNWPHGHTTIVQALSLGKPVITTRGATTSDYVVDGHNGLIVEAGDVEGYRDAILRLHLDKTLRDSLRVHIDAARNDLTYSAFAARLANLCLEVML